MGHPVGGIQQAVGFTSLTTQEESEEAAMDMKVIGVLQRPV
jgi:hypothetical protein